MEISFTIIANWTMSGENFVKNESLACAWNHTLNVHGFKLQNTRNRAKHRLEVMQGWFGLWGKVQHLIFPIQFGLNLVVSTTTRFDQILYLVFTFSCQMFLLFQGIHLIFCFPERVFQDNRNCIHKHTIQG